MTLSTTLIGSSAKYNQVSTKSDKVNVSRVVNYDSRLNASVPIKTEQEEDGRWIADAPDLPGVMVYGDTKEQAIQKIRPLIFRVIADRLEHGEHIPERIYSDATTL